MVIFLNLIKIVSQVKELQKEFKNTLKLIFISFNTFKGSKLLKKYCF